MTGREMSQAEDPNEKVKSDELEEEEEEDAAVKVDE